MADETNDPTRGLDASEQGPEDAEVKVSVAEEPIQMMEQPIHQAEVSFMEEIAEAYQAETIPVVIGEDGLPQPLDGNELAVAPAFTYYNMVCVEDARKYVEMFRHEAKGGRFAYTRQGVQVPRRTWEAGRVVFDQGKAFVFEVRNWLARLLPRWFAERVPVRPIRPVCKHYKRQIFVNDDQPNPDLPGHKIIFRNCEARRSIGGAALTLRDEAVYACEWRSPPDPTSVAKHLDAFDNEKLSSTAHLVRLPLFGNRG